MKNVERKYINVKIFKTGTYYLEKLSNEEIEVICVLMEWVQLCLFEISTKVL